MNVCSQMALAGVRLTGWTFPRARGSRPDRPSAKRTRVAAFVLAMETAKTEFKTAMRRKIQALPQNLLASTKHGFSGEAPKDSICCVPHPMRTAQEQNR